MQFAHTGVPAKLDGMRYLESKNVIAEPFDVFGEVRVGFIEVDGAPVEFVQPY